MYCLPRILGAAAAIGLCASAHASWTYAIADWQGARDGAISCTFDDSRPGQFTTGLPILNTNGIRGTFFVQSDTHTAAGTPTWQDARDAALAGHEIASHSTDGQSFQFQPLATVEQKLIDSKAAIESEIGSAIPGYLCLTIGWPFGYGGLDDDVRGAAIQAGYIGARNAGNTIGATNSYNSAAPSQWWRYSLNQHTWVIGDALIRDVVTQQQFEDQLDLVAANNAWTVFTYHGVNDGPGTLNVTTAQFTDQMTALGARDDLWTAPFGEVLRYVLQRFEATLSLVTSSTTELTFTLTDTLDDTIYNIPLTIAIDNVESWTGVTATQDGSPVDATIEGGQILVSAVPDAGTIVVSEDGGCQLVVPALDIVQTGATTYEIQWDSVSCLYYRVNTTDDFSVPNNWTPGTEMPGTGAQMTYEFDVSGGTRMFYQVEVSDQPFPPDIVF